MIISTINKLPEDFQNILQQARKEATDLTNAGINGFVVVNKNEILIMDTADKNNATKVWRWNVNGLGFSSTGYYGEYNTALTMDGKLVLNELTCEGINAMLINAGILKSLNGESWINLDNGEAQLTGELRSRKGEQWVALNAGGLTFQDWNKEEQMLRVGIAYFDSNRDINGVEFAMPQYSDFIRFSHIAKPNLNEGWTSEDTFYNFFELWSSKQTVNGVVKKKGMTINSPLWINNNINIASNDSNSPHNIYNTTEGKLLICGDNGVIIGYRNGTQNLIRLYINETDDSNGCAINAYGNWNFNGGAIKNANIVNTYANTETRTVAEVSTLETNSTDNIRYIYKDITSKDNKIILNIPSEYLGRHYDIIGVAKFGFGDYRISSKEENRFIIETDREMTMNIEISIE